MVRASDVRWVLDGRYAVTRALGSGGFGEVFLARDEILGRDVALKVLSRRCADDGKLIERFGREARSAASLSHPNVVAVHDFGQNPEDGAPYIVMEYVPGYTLADLVKKEGALASRTAVAIALGVARGLEAAHRRGVVHRDVKPANILLADTLANAPADAPANASGNAVTPGAVKVADFGVACALDDGTLTEENAVVGTAHYLSPEQAMGRAASPASDLYSLGVVLYEMLVGRRPFEAEDAESPLAVAMKHVTEEPDPPSASNPEIPSALDALVMRLLAKDPEGRPAGAAALAEELEELGRMDGSFASDFIGNGIADVDRRSTPNGIGVSGRTAGTEEPATLRIPPPHGGRTEPAGNDARTGRRGGRGGRIGFVAPAAALLFVAFLTVSAVALGGERLGERLWGMAGWARVIPFVPGASDAGGQAQTGQAGRPASDKVAPGGTDDGPSGLKEAGADAEADTGMDAGAKRAAIKYYEAVDQKNWAYTYGKLDSRSQEMFTEREWRRRNQWFAENEGLELASMQVDVTGLSASGTEAGVNVLRTFGNGVVIDRDTAFVFEEGSWKHRLIGRELFLFMPGATHGEFVEAR